MFEKLFNRKKKCKRHIYEVTRKSKKIKGQVTNFYDELLDFNKVTYSEKMCVVCGHKHIGDITYDVPKHPMKFYYGGYDAIVFYNNKCYNEDDFFYWFIKE
jgi:hypothetical protein